MKEFMRGQRSTLYMYVIELEQEAMMYRRSRLLVERTSSFSMQSMVNMTNRKHL